jgi:hypothetical protein
MDVFAHALWTIFAGSRANKKLKEKINLVWLAAFGIMPDVLSFAPLFVLIVFQFFTGNFHPMDFHHPSDLEPAQPDTLPILGLTNLLYSFFHSAVIFAVVFFIIYLITKRWQPVMLGWLLHILIDIPTHSYQFYPTPVFWPLSHWEFNGLSWATPWFMILNYSALIIVWGAVLWKRRKVKAERNKAVA